MRPKAILVGVFAIGAALFYAGRALWRWRTFHAAQYWPSATGTILESCVYRESEDAAEEFRVRYEFTADSKVIGDTPRLCGKWFWTLAAQREFVGRFQPGQSVDVYFDPEDPSRNCLDRDDVTSFLAEATMAVIFLGVGVLLLWLGGVFS